MFSEESLTIALSRARALLAYCLRINAHSSKAPKAVMFAPKWNRGREDMQAEANKRADWVGTIPASII